jgi:GTP 3',8-cyclase
MTNLVDPCGRVIDYFRISITDLCNFRCIYCRPPSGVKLVSHEDILRYEEILTIIRLVGEMGVKKIRVTGGEPLVRRDVLDFISKLSQMQGIEDIGLTTNGVKLPEMASDLRAAGLTRINISLDSLRPSVFKAITGFDQLDTVMEGIHKALECGFDKVKINVVLLAGMNDEDIPGFARLTLDYPLDVRFIERMPFGAEQIEKPPASTDAQKALKMIEARLGRLEPLNRGPLDGPATMYRLAGAQGRIGIIDPITGHFCGTCNRMRLTARGTLRPCLLSPHEIDIKTPLRNRVPPAELKRIIRNAVLAKPGGQSRPLALADGMNMIGG